MDQEIKQLIDTIKFNSEYSEACLKDILEYNKSDIFIKHHTSSIKAKQEDNIRLLSALKQLIC